MSIWSRPLSRMQAYSKQFHSDSIPKDKEGQIELSFIKIQ